MTTVRIAIHAVELRDADPLQRVITVTATARGNAGRSDGPFGAAATPLGTATQVTTSESEVPTPSLSGDVDIGESPAINIDVSVRIEAILGTDTSAFALSFSVPAPGPEPRVVRHETSSLRVVGILVSGAGSRESRAVIQRAGVALDRSTHVISSTRSHPRVEIVDPTYGAVCPVEGHLADVVRMGLWEEAWELVNDTPSSRPYDGAPEMRFRNGEIESDHFVGLDPRRFYLRVYDPDAPGPSVTVRFKTLLANGHAYDDGNGHPEITCSAVPHHRGLFASRAVMLVSSVADRSMHVHSGLPVGERAWGDPDFRLRRADMHGSVEVRYGDDPATEVRTRVEVFGPRERRSLRLRFYDVNRALAQCGEPLLFADHAPMTGRTTDTGPDAVWTLDLARAREIYARLGIWLWSDADARVSAQTAFPAAHPREHLMHLTDDGTLFPTSELARRSTTQVAASGATTGIRIFYLNAMDGSDNGVAWTDNYAGDARTRRSIFINTRTRNAETLAHEILHVLVNSGVHGPETVHYPRPSPDWKHNLLRGAGRPPECRGHDIPCRIRLSQIQDIDAMIGSIAGTAPAPTVEPVPT